MEISLLVATSILVALETAKNWAALKCGKPHHRFAVGTDTKVSVGRMSLSVQGVQQAVGARVGDGDASDPPQQRPKLHSSSLGWLGQEPEKHFFIVWSAVSLFLDHMRVMRCVESHAIFVLAAALSIKNMDCLICETVIVHK